MAQTGKHTAHTPGPWVSRLATASVPTTQVYSSTGHVASAIGKNHEANARLIAAAPDLLAALKLLDVWFNHTGSSINARWERIPPVDRLAIVNATRAAIAKAEGR